MTTRPTRSKYLLNNFHKISNEIFSPRFNFYAIHFLVLVGFFLSSAFFSVGFIPFVYGSSLQEEINISATPTPQALAEEIKSRVLASKDQPEKLAQVDPDLDFVSFRYHSWDVPEEISLESDFWIQIDLTNQILYAYRGNQIINGFRISSGTDSHTTVTGTYKIFSKYPAIRMTGPGYDLPDVPFTLFFYKGYALHGTYWHNNFGTPMSHGCINMETKDALWIYENAPVGTYIIIHY